MQSSRLKWLLLTLLVLVLVVVIWAVVRFVNNKAPAQDTGGAPVEQITPTEQIERLKTQPMPLDASGNQQQVQTTTNPQPTPEEALKQLEKLKPAAPIDVSGKSQPIQSDTSQTTPQETNKQLDRFKTPVAPLTVP